jgi:hypothetical protein
MAEPASRVASLPQVQTGVCYALFAYEVGQSIDLDEAQRRITEVKERATIRHKRRAPRYFEFHPAPLRVTQEADPLAVGVHRTADHVDALIYDFGAISVSYTLPFSGSLARLLALSEALYDNSSLLADSRTRVDELLARIAPAVARGCVADVVETYAIFQIGAFTTPIPPSELQANCAQELAQILRSERVPLSDQEVRDATSHAISFSSDDLALIDWDAAVLIDPEADDVRDVLEFANVELLEMRFLDQQLDDALTASYETLNRRQWRRPRLPGASRTELKQVGRLQVDAALLFEGVNNALKLLGDQYLARVYRLVSERFHLAEWDASILRKIQTLESIYQKMSNAASSRRLEVLEWIIIVLIAASIAIPLLGPMLLH